MEAEDGRVEAAVRLWHKDAMLMLGRASAVFR